MKKTNITEKRQTIFETIIGITLSYPIYYMLVCLYVVVYPTSSVSVSSSINSATKITSTGYEILYNNFIPSKSPLCGCETPDNVTPNSKGLLVNTNNYIISNADTTQRNLLPVFTVISPFLNNQSALPQILYKANIYKYSKSKCDIKFKDDYYFIKEKRLSENADLDLKLSDQAFISLIGTDSINVYNLGACCVSSIQPGTGTRYNISYNKIPIGNIPSTINIESRSDLTISPYMTYDSTPITLINSFIDQNKDTNSTYDLRGYDYINCRQYIDNLSDTLYLSATEIESVLLEDTTIFLNHDDVIIIEIINPFNIRIEPALQNRETLGHTYSIYFGGELQYTYDYLLDTNRAFFYLPKLDKLNYLTLKDTAFKNWFNYFKTATHESYLASFSDPTLIPSQFRKTHLTGSQEFLERVVERLTIMDGHYGLYDKFKKNVVPCFPIENDVQENWNFTFTNFYDNKESSCANYDSAYSRYDTSAHFYRIYDKYQLAVFDAYEKLMNQRRHRYMSIADWHKIMKEVMPTGYRVTNADNICATEIEYGTFESNGLVTEAEAVVYNESYSDFLKRQSKFLPQILLINPDIQNCTNSIQLVGKVDSLEYFSNSGSIIYKNVELVIGDNDLIKVSNCQDLKIVNGNLYADSRNEECNKFSFNGTGVFTLNNQNIKKVALLSFKSNPIFASIGLIITTIISVVIVHLSIISYIKIKKYNNGKRSTNSKSKSTNLKA